MIDCSVGSAHFGSSSALYFELFRISCPHLNWQVVVEKSDYRKH